MVGTAEKIKIFFSHFTKKGEKSLDISTRLGKTKFTSYRGKNNIFRFFRSFSGIRQRSDADTVNADEFDHNDYKRLQCSVKNKMF